MASGGASSEEDGSFDASGMAVLPLTGELDIAAAPGIIEAGTKCLATTSAVLVVDLAQVTFLDSTALSALVHLRNEAVSQGKTLIVANPQPNVRRVFEITALTEPFGISPPQA